MPPPGLNREIVGPRQRKLPSDDAHVIVEAKRWWSDQWVVYAELDPRTLTLNTGNGAGSTLVLERPYGPRVMLPGEQAYSERLPAEIDGWWIKVSLQTPVSQPGQPATLVFLGRIESLVQEIGGAHVPNESAEARSQGMQTWTAYGPKLILDKINIWTSWWEKPAGHTSTLQVLELGRTTSFNKRDRFGRLLGNRSSVKYPNPDTGLSSYVFGGAEMWTHEQIIEYLLAWYVNRSQLPHFEITGDVQLIWNMADVIELGPTASVGRLIDRCVRTADGLDYVVRPGQSGLWGEFVGLEIISLSDQPFALGNFTFPANSRRMRFNLSAAANVGQAKIEQSQVEQYDEIWCIGERIVSCLSVGEGAPSDAQALWSGAAETAYNANSDHNRTGDNYRDVYQAFGVPSDFDFQAGKANPLVSYDGSTFLAANSPYQKSERATLSWLPLRESEAGDVHEADMLPPFAAAQTVGVAVVMADMLSAEGVDRRAAAVGVLEHEWGLRLRSAPNHAFGLNQFTGDSEFKPYDPATQEYHGVDYRFMSLTFAIRTDHRVVVGIVLNYQNKRNDGAVKVIPVAGAEFWWLAPQTIKTVSGSSRVLASSLGEVLRDDTAKLARIAVGEYTRFLLQRNRMTITFKALAVWNTVLGWLLDATEEDDSGVVTQVAGVITSVVFDFAARTTTVYAGQATR